MEKKGRGATPVPPVRQVEEKGFFERKMPETAKKYAKKERLSTLLFRMSDCGDPFEVKDELFTCSNVTVLLCPL